MLLAKTSIENMLRAQQRLDNRVAMLNIYEKQFVECRIYSEDLIGYNNSIADIINSLLSELLKTSFSIQIFLPFLAVLDILGSFFKIIWLKAAEFYFLYISVYRVASLLKRYVCQDVKFFHFAKDLI